MADAPPSMYTVNVPDHMVYTMVFKHLQQELNAANEERDAALRARDRALADVARYEQLDAGNKQLAYVLGRSGHLEELYACYQNMQLAQDVGMDVPAPTEWASPFASTSANMWSAFSVDGGDGAPSYGGNGAPSHGGNDAPSGGKKRKAEAWAVDPKLLSKKRKD